MRRILTPLAFFIAGIVCIGCPQSIFGQAARAIPSWLVNYPGVTAQSSTSPGYFELTYEAAAKPEELIAHYRKLFAAQGLNFQPNFDGIGTAIRGETRECDLLLLIRRQGAGSWVQVSGAAKSMVRSRQSGPSYNCGALTGRANGATTGTHATGSPECRGKTQRTNQGDGEVR